MTATRYKLQVKPPNIISLMILSAFASMGAILMMPALPEISAHFGTDTSTTQLTVTCFLLGYALGQLFYGPLANRYGRKHAIFVGIIIASIGSIFSIASSPLESFDLMLLGRFLEAVGASAGLTVSVAIINDFYFEQDVRRIMGFVLLAFAIVPGIAVAIGGVLVQFIHWQSCFYFLLLYGLLLIYPTIRLPETNLTPDFCALKYHNVLNNYWKHLKIKKLMGFALISGVSPACVYVFGAEGPFIGIHLLHIQPAIYGILALTPFIGTLVGSLSVMRLSKINPLLVIKIAFCFELIASTVMFILFIFHYVSLTTMLIPMGIFCIGHPLIGATAISLSMQQTDDKSNGSAIVNFTSMCVPILMTFLLSISHSKNPVVMPSIFLISLILMVGLFLWCAGEKNEHTTPFGSVTRNAM
ncbi:MAG: Bcr/CflA family efflux MFS transporter [Gammaproteobacteria bacterium]|nr:Bcr/CflA family efflux MFS transporter [Gammaproteobacteria bacterium]